MEEPLAPTTGPDGSASINFRESTRLHPYVVFRSHGQTPWGQEVTLNVLTNIMRIAVIRKECSLRQGGAERYCANLCRELAARGHHVYVLAQQMDKDLHPDLDHVPIRVSSFGSSAKNISFHRNSQRALRQLHVDRVYALSRSYPADALRVSDPLHSTWMKLRYRSKWRLFIERLNPRHRTILSLEKKIFNPANTKVIITNSKLTKRQVHQLFGFPQERIHVVYNGVDLKKFSPLGEVVQISKKVRLLFVGMEFRRKGLQELLKGLSLIKHGLLEYSLDIVGKGDEKCFRRMAENFGIAGNVRFHGPSPMVEEFYRAADLLVFPTRYDPFANVCLEALACGLPVATTTTNGAAEIIQDGETGFILNGSSDLADQIAARISFFGAMSPESRRQMAKMARRKAESFTIGRNVDETLAILRSL
jgi:UDP-glucose:(heptosyl)LPS alpha-1,3-glucosyltransferase